MARGRFAERGMRTESRYVYIGLMGSRVPSGSIGAVMASQEMGESRAVGASFAA